MLRSKVAVQVGASRSTVVPQVRAVDTGQTDGVCPGDRRNAQASSHPAAVSDPRRYDTHALMVPV